MNRERLNVILSSNLVFSITNVLYICFFAINLFVIGGFFITNDGIFSYIKPVVDAFDPRLLIAPSISHVIDFTKIKVRGFFFSFLFTVHFVETVSFP